MDKITVIMPCYIVSQELLQLTQNAVDSFGDVNLVVIDNASFLGGGYLRSVADLYIKNAENLGYAKAVNQGLRLTSSRHIAIANNDIRVSPNWKEVVLESFDDQPNTFSVHPRMTDYSTPFRYGKSTIYRGKERWCTGSFFVIDGDKKQYYDENFLNSYDDWDYFISARKKGYYTAYTDKACYQHHHSTTQQLIPEREENNKRNAEYFKEKWGKYAEAMFEELYPDQMVQDYGKGFEI